MTDAPHTEPVPKRRSANHWYIFVGLLIGAIGGLIAKAMYPPGEDGKDNPDLAWAVANVAKPAGEVFLRLIFMIVVPLVVSALILGVAGLGDARRLGRVGLKSFGYTVLLSGLAVVIGLGMANTIQPGSAISAETREELVARYADEAEQTMQRAKAGKSTRDALLDLIPRNPLRELVGATDGSSPGGGILAVMFFALAIGTALLFNPARAAPLLAVLEGVFDACMGIIQFAMRLAPIGVAGLMFGLTATVGVDVLKLLGWFVATALGAMLIQYFVVYSIAISTLGSMSPARFFSRISEVTLTAFATSSSNATLPTALRVARTRLGLRADVSNFVLTIGATANQNGTALYEGITVLFLCQVFGVQLDLGQQLGLMLICILAGIGTAGVPSGALPFIALVAASYGAPASAIGIIVGVDRVLDMCRTVVNVTGDIVIAACVNRGEAALEPTPASAAGP
ncbi:MAG: dicarboxylate/amino acid:cation symporter [Planctomycetia bacterium]|nr:MAG: dicarboxylate/amino acid:cation symporter [Planctomycetia bacterium]